MVRVLLSGRREVFNGLVIVHESVNLIQKEKFINQKDFFVPAQELYEIANEIKKPSQKIYIKTFDEAIGDLFKNNQENKICL